MKPSKEWKAEVVKQNLRLRTTGKKKDTEISNLKKEVLALKQVQTNFEEAQWKWDDEIKKKNTEIYNLRKHIPDQEALIKLRDENVGLRARGDIENRDHEVVKMKFELCKQIFDLAGVALKLDVDPTE